MSRIDLVLKSQLVEPTPAPWSLSQGARTGVARTTYTYGWPEPIYTPCMTVYLVISLPKTPYIYGSGQLYIYTVFLQENHEIYDHIR